MLWSRVHLVVWVQHLAHWAKTMHSKISSTVNTINRQAEYSDQYWASRLIECMTAMGEQKTNSVLLSLDNAQSVKPYKRYPNTPYYFGNKHWRAFYHCHESPANENEHGHYHFFTRQGQEDEWCHVVALGMNDVGQPTRLFTTNLWVTDGKWFDAGQLLIQISVLADSQDEGLVTSWLKHVLLLFQYEISDLLIARDNNVEQLFPSYHEQCFLDRSIYYLSEVNVNLNERLTGIFSQTSANI